MTTTLEPTFAERVGARIERARLMRGHSLRSLAEALDGKFSHTTLQKYEKGTLCPDTGTLGLLARALEIRVDYFLNQDQFKLETVEYRKLSKLGKKEQKQIEEEAFEFFERYLEIENIMAVSFAKLPVFDLTNQNGEELADAIENAALSIRKGWRLGLNPIPNVHTMLEEHGIKVKIMEGREGFDGFSAIARAGKQEVPTVALSGRNMKDLPRLRFTALHELAHLVLRLPERLSNAEKKRACHRFAGALLIPKQVFIKIFGENRQKISVPELKAIKGEWGISCSATMARARDLELITAGRFKSFCIMANKWGWRTNEPGRWVGEETSSRFKHLVFRALAEEIITTSKACGLLDLTNGELAEEFELVG